MRMVVHALVILSLLFAGCAIAAEPYNALQDLASSLSNWRDGCSLQAQHAAQEASQANYQSALDLENANLKAQMDAKVYGVGHGARETNGYLLSLLQKNAAASSDEAHHITAKLKSDNVAVQDCTARAKELGKSEYMRFKADKRNKRQIQEAEALVTAWLTNISEISTDSPQGDASSLSAWKSAKAHVEIAEL